MDYTPGTFDILYKNRKEYTKWNSNDKGNSRVNTTLAKQLAMWVCLYSPMQMASDLVDNYENQPAFKFFKYLSADFDESKVLAAEIGDYYSVARRSKDKWFVGTMSDEHSREMELQLSFLDKGKEYVATIYSDGTSASLSNPTDLLITTQDVDSESTILVKLAESGGHAMLIMPKN